MGTYNIMRNLHGGVVRLFALVVRLWGKVRDFAMDAVRITGAVTTTSGAAAAPAQVTHVVVLEPKKGGRLAFKGLLTAFILASSFMAAT